MARLAGRWKRYGFPTFPHCDRVGSERPLCVSSGAATSKGANPYGGLVFDASGNLYGTTLDGALAVRVPRTN